MSWYRGLGAVGRSSADVQLHRYTQRSVRGVATEIGPEYEESMCG